MRQGGLKHHLTVSSKRFQIKRLHVSEQGDLQTFRASTNDTEAMQLIERSSSTASRFLWAFSGGTHATTSSPQIFRAIFWKELRILLQHLDVKASPQSRTQAAQLATQFEAVPVPWTCPVQHRTPSQKKKGTPLTFQAPGDWINDLILGSCTHRTSHRSVAVVKVVSVSE